MVGSHDASHPVGKCHGHRAASKGEASYPGEPGVGRYRRRDCPLLRQHEAAGPGPRGYYDAHVMIINSYSRFLLGIHVHASETGPRAEEMIREAFGIHGIPQRVHAYCRASMTSKPVATLLAALEVNLSHARPEVSNDNPNSEAWFKALKSHPALPRPIRLYTRGQGHH